MKRIQRWGIFGAIGGGILCLTPLLAIGLGALGLGWLTIYADIALSIIIVVSLGVLGWNWRQRNAASR